MDAFRPHRRAARIGVEHLLASSAIPFVFPATSLRIDDRAEWFGDGSIRQTAPISPAIHLGAQKVLVIGAGRMHESRGADGTRPTDYPPPAQVAGHAMSTIFVDGLALDIEHLERVNHTLSLLPRLVRALTPWQSVEILVIAPSRPLDEIAARHVASMPRPVRALLRGLGVSSSDPRGAALASYLLFEPPYTGELIELGEADALARHADVRRFFGWPASEGAGTAHRAHAAPRIELDIAK